ncbi:uncharacterized protein LOC122365170 [Amphibalanus amphitrite]|uniref:uncharacterized protein LOC122365170 n=1 Tax=Amphibalanus amphitrite TaxID=1232801 RepID=UPI001C9087E9|nr:uncharacterized protein LOC122365170 [Amphibalanus amphitrite]
MALLDPRDSRYRRRLGSARRKDPVGLSVVFNRKLWLFLPSEQERQGWRRLLTTFGTEAVQQKEQEVVEHQEREESRDLLFELVQKELENENGSGAKGMAASTDEEEWSIVTAAIADADSDERRARVIHRATPKGRIYYAK